MTTKQKPLKAPKGTLAIRPRSARQAPVSQADVARVANVERSTVSRAVRAGGALHGALLPGGRLDANHAGLLRWVARGGDMEGAWAGLIGFPASPRTVPLVILETAIELAEAAERLGVDPVSLEAQCADPLAPALVPDGHLSLGAFAEIADCSLGEVIGAVRGEQGDLTPALLASGRIAVGHPAALAFLAARPFGRLANGDPESTFLPALVGEDDIDVDHPITRAWIARVQGSVPGPDFAHGAESAP
jgi:hypothetical protein